MQPHYVGTILLLDFLFSFLIFFEIDNFMQATWDPISSKNFINFFQLNNLTMMSFEIMIYCQAQVQVPGQA